jgi:LPXTG-motif cell wall-anchored protein
LGLLPRIQGASTVFMILGLVVVAALIGVLVMQRKKERAQ